MLNDFPSLSLKKDCWILILQRKINLFDNNCLWDPYFNKKVLEIKLFLRYLVKVSTFKAPLSVEGVMFSLVQI